MKYELKCADTEQKSLFYSDCEPTLRNACIGHVRMDFGSGNEFWTSWWGNREDMNDSAFKAELNDVVNTLRKDGLLKNRYEMQSACANNASLALGEGHGFLLKPITTFFSFAVSLGRVTTAIFTATTRMNCSLRSPNYKIRSRSRTKPNRP